MGLKLELGEINVAVQPLLADILKTHMVILNDTLFIATTSENNCINTLKR